MSDDEHPVLRQIKDAARQEGRDEAADDLTRLRAQIAAADRLAEAAREHEEAFSILEDSFQIAARDKLIAALSTYEEAKK